MKKNQKSAGKIICILLATVFLLTAGWLAFDRYVDRSGWIEKDGVYSYRDFHGKKVTGWLQYRDHSYYFDENFAMLTHWQEIDGNRYFFGADGAMVTGWKTIDNQNYYFLTDGTLHTGWLELDGQRYYMADSGTMHTGWLTLDGSTYYFTEAGTQAFGWNTVDQNRYYFDESGNMITGHITMDGNQYYFQDNGALFLGWEDTEDGRRYYDDEGILCTGWTEVEDRLYLFNETGIMQTGWQQVGEYRYYLQEDGSAAVGPVVIDGDLYHFTPHGIQVVLVNSHLKVPGYYDPDLVTYFKWHQVSEVALEPLKKMLEDCAAAGYKYEFNSGYRSIKAQEEILYTRTKEHMDLGYSEADAYKEARKTVALPGTSEHHLGLAVDIVNIKSEEKMALEWLGEHCWEYGFILRYTADKADITGIIEEPWHFRYVGTEVSMDMKDSGLCLEEYLGAA